MPMTHRPCHRVDRRLDWREQRKPRTVPHRRVAYRLDNLRWWRTRRSQSKQGVEKAFMAIPSRWWRSFIAKQRFSVPKGWARPGFTRKCGDYARIQKLPLHGGDEEQRHGRHRQEKRGQTRASVVFGAHLASAVSLFFFLFEGRGEGGVDVGFWLAPQAS